MSASEVVNAYLLAFFLVTLACQRGQLGLGATTGLGFGISS
jgi:hypothetical protein